MPAYQDDRDGTGIIYEWLEAQPIAIAFSEPVTGFELEDLVVGNGSSSALQGNNASYTATSRLRPRAP